MSKSKKKAKVHDTLNGQPNNSNTLGKIWETHYANTVTLSNVSRQLAFANVAICWLFRVEKSFILDGPVLVAFIFALIYFFCDLAQYISAAYIHYSIANRRENELNSRGINPNENEPCYKDKEDNKLPYLFLKLKVGSIFISYILLLYHYVNILLGYNNAKYILFF